MEVHFYLAYPFYLKMRKSAGTFIVPVILLTVSLLVYGSARIALAGDARFVVQHLFVVTWWQWGLGVLLADMHIKRTSWVTPLFSFPGAVVLWTALSLGLAWSHLTLLGLHVNVWILPILCFLILGSAISGSTLRIPFLERLGTATYSLYLIHPVALASVFAFRERLSNNVFASLSIAFSIALGLVFFQLVERHFIVKWRVAPTPQNTIAA